ncbi:adenosylmethionine decarboxylase [Acidianus sulfidivorans JP7]|uniref:S-adenosylmethionine decarboxylase proenzyme n=2 Tax=Acidianus TaxID=12914 RepID=A0A2U9INJ5_9CREN|nr:adenosylmethionine decarboxylase [Acidianus sulfidivorans JP7]
MGVKQEVFPKVVGKQVYGNLYDCDNEKLKDVEALKKIVADAANIGNMTVLDIKAWKIGEGASVVAIILESHITIHTWPEYNFATVDVYSCGAHSNPKNAFMHIVEELKAKRYIMNEADRSSDF